MPKEPENQPKDPVKPEWVKLLWDPTTPSEQLAEHIIELLDDEPDEDDD